MRFAVPTLIACLVAVSATPGSVLDNRGELAISNTTTSAAATANKPLATNENGVPRPAAPVLEYNSSLSLNQSLLLNTSANANISIGQVASATSNNNFIDFCVGKNLTNGRQIAGGSCSVTPIGDIPSVQNLVSTTFTSPVNGAQIKANTTFTISLAARGITLGSFTDAQKDYYAAPQQLDSTGQIIGHAHVVVQEIESLNSTALLDPQEFVFFKGLDFGPVNNISSVDVQNGLPSGAYRLCSLMTSSNHVSVILPVAQRGSENTCSYFTVH